MYLLPNPYSYPVLISCNNNVFIEFTTIIHTVGPRVGPPATREYQGVPGSPTYYGRSSKTAVIFIAI